MQTRRKLLMMAIGFGLAVPVFAEGEAQEATQPASTQASQPAAAAESKGESAATLKVDLKVAKDVKDREPVDVSTTFGADTEQVVGWSKIEGAKEPVEVKHVYALNGKEVASIPQQVKSSSYRTWTRKTVAGMPGKWTFSVQDASGKTLASTDFEVTGAAAAPAPAK
jgi:hypothetical protein